MQNEPSLTRKLVAEFLGTGLLTLIGAGSVTATITLEAGSKAPFSEADLGVISFAFAFIIVAMVYAIGKISGCHINPAVTVALALTRRVDWGTAAAYIVAQFIGAVAGAFGIVAMFGTDAASKSILGVTSFGATVSPVQAIVAEGIGTFILVFAIYGVAVDPRSPSRAFGTVFVQALMGGKSFYGQYYVYVIGPVVGGALGGLVYDFLAQPKLAEERATLEAKTTEPAAAASR